jgi:hypothetical protein
MSDTLPKYMSIGDFRAFSGFSRYQFMRVADKANLPIKALGRFRMVDVQEALAAIEALPDADREVPVNPPAQEAASQAAE